MWCGSLPLLEEEGSSHEGRGVAGERGEHERGGRGAVGQKPAAWRGSPVTLRAAADATRGAHPLFETVAFTICTAAENAPTPRIDRIAPVLDHELGQRDGERRVRGLYDAAVRRFAELHPAPGNPDHADPGVDRFADAAASCAR